jgi:hypothetical protein
MNWPLVLAVITSILASIAAEKINPNWGTAVGYFFPVLTYVLFIIFGVSGKYISKSK